MKVYYNEEGYIQLLKDLASVPVTTPDRTGCGTQKSFALTLCFPDITKAFPLLTSRPVPLRLSVEEMLFFCNGRVQTKELEAKGINFWKDNTTREFLDARGLNYLPEGHMGYAYGAVMRHAGGDYDKDYNPTGGFDQLRYVYETLKKDIWSRRAMIELWSPQDLGRMALTPCCHNYNFCATMGEDGIPVLNLAVKIRSSDVLFGLGGDNAPQFGFLLTAMAKLVGARPGALSFPLVDAHIYSGGYANQLPYVMEAVQRDFSPLPQLEITKELNTLEDFLSMTMDDIRVLNYNPNKTPMKEKRPPMAA